jgi:uncharacterized protein YbjT (DUF2867 family)
MIGRHLISALGARGHEVRALARPGSEKRLPAGCAVVTGNPLKRTTFQEHVAPADTFVHLVGVTHPSPFKAGQFRTVDLASVRESVSAALAANVGHFVYLSVAQPAPIMKAYAQARQEGEGLIRQSGLNATFVRPWYVLGPGRRWPMLLVPFYRIAEYVPAARAAAKRLGLVTIEEMTLALLEAVEVPAVGVRILDVPTLRAIAHARQKTTN